MQANVRFVLDGQQIENVLNFNFPAGEFQASAATVYGLLNETWWALLRVQLSNQLVSVETYIVDLTSQSGETATFPAFTDPAGNITAEAEANSIALCVTLRTVKRGRSYRGRSYVAGLATSNVTQNTVDTSVTSGIANAYIALHNDAIDAGVLMVVVSRRQNKEWLTVGVATPVTFCLVRDRTVDSQRRRLPGRGR
jgi:hypothetical protein